MKNNSFITVINVVSKHADADKAEYHVTKVRRLISTNI